MVYLISIQFLLKNSKVTIQAQIYDGLLWVKYFNWNKSKMDNIGYFPDMLPIWNEI